VNTWSNTVIATHFDGSGAPFRYLVEDRFGRVVGEAIDLASDGVEATHTMTGATRRFFDLLVAETWVRLTDQYASNPLEFL
jgi:hypothetical protein